MSDFSARGKKRIRLPRLARAQDIREVFNTQDRDRPEALLAAGEHLRLQKLCIRQLRGRWLNAFGPRQKLALYYLARSYYLQGRFEKSQTWLDKLLEIDPRYPDARYLAADLARVRQQNEQAWQQLESLYPHNPRPKTWLYMAQLVQTHEDWERLYDNYQQALKLRRARPTHPVCTEYLAVGSQRAGRYEHARELWRQILLRFDPRRSRPPRRKTPSFRPDRAATALSDIRRVMARANIEMFLVSGTLLGCIRENRLLSHDHDIDIGIWDSVPEQRLINAISASGCFHMLPRRECDCLRVKHTSGTAIDVFVHYEENGLYWHGGVKVRWYNTPFELKTVEFLGEQYLIPHDADRYLTENYGDWRTPRTGFDSTLDTPNAEVLSLDELVIHCFKKLYSAMRQKRRDAIERYCHKLTELGEGELVRQLRV